MSNPRNLQELADSLAASAQWRAQGQGLGGPYSAGYADALLDTRATVLAMIAEAENANRNSYYTIERDDIGRSYIEAFGKTWRLADVIGRVQPLDVGKRVYQRDGVLSVENDQQRDARLARES